MTDEVVEGEKLMEVKSVRRRKLVHQGGRMDDGWVVVVVVAEQKLSEIS